MAIMKVMPGVRLSIANINDADVKAIASR